MATAADHLATASLPVIVSTGLLLGVVHVLTGPDHLSALIVLSAGSSWRSCQLGMRWGCGHSVGLIVVTAVFLALNMKFDVDKFGTYCDFCVGLLMIALGTWSFAHYWNMRPAKHLPVVVAKQELLEAASSSGTSYSGGHGHSHGGPYGHSHGPATSTSVLPARDGRDDESLPLLAVQTKETKNGPPSTWCCGLLNRPQVDIKNAHTQRVTAFAYGIAHGLAGTGGILGVLPAVILNDWIKSWAYLLSFCVASIFIMGVFAATYGEITGRIVRMSDQLLFQVGLFSSCVSLVVGVLWVVLVSTGKLDQVFG